MGNNPPRKAKKFKANMEDLPVVLSSDHEHDFVLNVRRSEQDEDYNHLVCRCGTGILQHKG